jgi:regulator of protease activity HflC (stomatin/prohibitin superfamily)
VDSALAWVGQIADWIGRFFPRWVILDPREGGVKYVRGVVVTALGPGIHWYWPLLTTIDTYPTVRQADNLPTQVFTTIDDVTIAVGGLLVYDVTDVEKLLTTCHSAIRVVQDISLTAVHDVCANLTWEELKDKQRRGTLDTALKNAAQKQLADYGVRVIKCMLTDLAKTRVLKVIQSVNKDSE